MNVDPGLLAAAAAQADTESRVVFAGHSAADTVVAEASFGWVGCSRTALSAAAERWAQTTGGLSLRLYRFGESLRISALTFAETDAADAGTLAGIGPSMPPESP